MQGPMTYEELCDAIYDLQSDCVDLERQLEMYSSNPRTPDWPAKAKAALRIKLLQVQNLERRLKLIQGGSPVDASFVRAAKLMLEPELFSRIWEDAITRTVA